jgi:parallel beta-helix repeat protein
MNMKHFSALALLFCLANASFPQGPLTPPGAPAPTMKTLDQIEPRTPISLLPFTINASGSYYVTSNLTGVAGQHGITINADNVTLDLGGFELVGPGGAATAAIRLINAHTNATIRNGTVRGWLSSSVLAETAASTEMHVENLRVFNGGSAGILLGNNGTAKGCEVRACVATGIFGGTSCKIIECTSVGQTGAGGDGIFLVRNGTVTDCVVTGNGNRGIVTGDASVISHCVSSGNTATGIITSSQSTLGDCAVEGNGSTGIICSTGCTVTHCTASNNGGVGFAAASGFTAENCTAAGNISHGISLGDAATVRGCIAFNNGGNGIAVASGCVIADCIAESNTGQHGIIALSGCTITGCTARGNTSTSVTSTGINAGTECHVSRCIASNTASTAGTLTFSTGTGISANSGSTVEYCTVQGSTGDGIRTAGQCLIVGNTCDGNGTGGGDGAGIHTTSFENRIEGNNVTNNDRGIDVDSTGNLIIKNSAATNAIDYVIAASNRYGPIINITAAGAAAVSGNTAASTVASADPWANFSY